ncbi:class I SAM-dependent methyltransferase [Nocardia farcinica]|uniref:class I SAM-dependent methyltransferase n=1 Tax=Nocardia farcinica TaxID=37329 RepID=UPI0018932F6C|nr:class I SAM-dependent methyltransferase [Nocardia farcinica]MBF6360773.1 class I SAM-dependent methyltransferase [Nocardia farcinica]
MGFYTDQIVPRIFHAVCGSKDHDPLRQRTCAGLHGRVLEVGFGSGLNIPFYPDDVERVAGIEPAAVAWRLARKQLARSRIPVEQAGLDGRSLPFDDGTFDCALSTFTLCSIPEVETALAEIRRVLVPGGAFHFVEHGKAPDPRVHRWQRRLDPFQRRAFAGCHLARDIPRLIRAAGFTIREMDTFYQPGGPKYLAALSLGVAVSPTA